MPLANHAVSYRVIIWDPHLKGSLSSSTFKHCLNFSYYWDISLYYRSERPFEVQEQQRWTWSILSLECLLQAQSHPQLCCRRKYDCFSLTLPLGWEKDSWNTAEMKIGLSTAHKIYGDTQPCGACLNAANKPSCLCLWRAPHPHRSQPRFGFVNSWPKSAFRCSQTIAISFGSWLANTKRIAPFVHNRIPSCIYPPCGETVIFEKYSTRWHYIGVHLFPYCHKPAIMSISLLFPRTAGAFSQPNQNLLSLTNRYWLHCKASP